MAPSLSCKDLPTGPDIVAGGKVLRMGARSDKTYTSSLHFCVRFQVGLGLVTPQNSNSAAIEAYSFVRPSLHPYVRNSLYCNRHYIPGIRLSDTTPVYSEPKCPILFRKRISSRSVLPQHTYRSISMPL